MLVPTKFQGKMSQIVCYYVDFCFKKQHPAFNGGNNSEIYIVGADTIRPKGSVCYQGLSGD